MERWGIILSSDSQVWFSYIYLSVPEAVVNFIWRSMLTFIALHCFSVSPLPCSQSTFMQFTEHLPTYFSPLKYMKLASWTGVHACWSIRASSANVVYIYFLIWVEYFRTKSVKTVNVKFRIPNLSLFYLLCMLIYLERCKSLHLNICWDSICKNTSPSVLPIKSI